MHSSVGKFHLIQSLILTLSLENHQDGVHLHRHGVTLSLQAILMCSNLPVLKVYTGFAVLCHESCVAVMINTKRSLSSEGVGFNVNVTMCG